MKKYFLDDEFDNDDINHFTHYDYLNQLVENGQHSAFKEHIKEITGSSLLRYYLVMEGSVTFKNHVTDEILKRMGE